MSSSNGPPAYQDAPPSNGLPPGLVEQAALAMDTANADQANRETNQRQSEALDQPKPEGSTYAGSYRPGAEGLAGVNIAVPNAVPNGETHNPDDVPPPAYSETYGHIVDDNNEIGTNATVAADGRVNIRINQKSRRLSQLLVPTLHSLAQADAGPLLPPPYIPESLGGAPGQEPPPPLNVVIHVVGSRGDVQPFVALGKVLKETYNHRVRLATHPTFKDFVTENGLEFFNIGGDPAELMAFMVKNPGLMPGFDTLRSGDIGKRRKGIADIIKGCWRSCIETGDGFGVESVKQTVEEWMGVDESEEAQHRPFVADAIIANPPSFAHVHCAEKLGVPLHMMFTMPWSPTQAFPHPLANIQSSNADASLSNFMSYTLVDMMTWQGLGDLINRFRKESLGLEPVSLMWAPGMLARLKIPYTYCWSPALIPKPRDWGNHISISGFFFLSLASNYHPEPDLAAFLAAGPAPVYIGFGSIVVDDPNAMTKLIFDAVKKTGQRALVSKGWGGLGADELGIPEGVFMLGNVPHDWLFQHVSCVVHHGGAGTTAAGIACGKPTVVVPFFGDQPFWGAMVAKAGAGPIPTPYKELTADKLAENIKEALKPTSLERAKELSQKISKEKGSDTGAQSFHQMLKVDELRCAVWPQKAAVWRVKRTSVRLSAMTATVLAQEGELNFGELKLYRPREYETDDGPWDPITGGATAIIGTASTMMMGVADFPTETLKLLNIYPDARKKTKNTESEGTSSNGASINGASTIRSGRSTTSRTDSIRSESSSTTALPGSDTPLAEASAQDLPTPTSPNRSGAMSPVSRNRFMKEAMRTQTQVSRPSSPIRSWCPICRKGSCNHTRHQRSTSQSEPESDTSKPGSLWDQNSSKFITPESAINTGKGITRILGAGFKSPMDFSMNVAKGFHNAPRLYGQEVRKVDKVTDLQSGLRTAAKEFGIGFYEGMAGLVKDPYQGAKKEGGAGFIKGVGRGIAGVPLKVMAGVWAVPGYTFKGIYQELQKEKGATVQNYIIAARMAQGYDEAALISAKERADILARWRCIKVNVKRKKNPGEEQLESLQAMLKEQREKRHARWEHARNVHLNRKKHGNPYLATSSDASSISDLSLVTSHESIPGVSRASTEMARGGLGSSQPLTYTSTFPQPHTLHDPQDAADAADLEEAIRLSVAETSQGNPEEDALLERAIRASAAELQRPPIDGEDEEATLQRAMTASINEASASGATEEEQRVLAEVLRKSLSETRRLPGSDSEWDSEVLSEDEEDVRRAVDQSKAAADAVAGAEGKEEGYPDDDESLRKALEASRLEDERQKSTLEKQRTEEEIVLEYVKKQSLAEEEHRLKMLGRKDGDEIKGESLGSGAGASGA
ncbi:UDP-Glycosyltransferase/glycogen phosphorylase [Mytilinidion resinicola]|uniref:UDP-Glycosyltransferase/glycogen phosphorylase n=1 Tax=Mytilinidion resinicola TaxID=574789 RepID=A0A6A6YK57_9PEZI|nr:UDP-Glycosyltransferase/glycogen phosphorylase [Mytilinidion resinicola]KAF2808344.1 UDP-Glycosyltransferase/glycogen phosphorylase [Mytilinidion resinicola]